VDEVKAKHLAELAAKLQEVQDAMVAQKQGLEQQLSALKEAAEQEKESNEKYINDLRR
jgi:hypothetical protein